MDQLSLFRLPIVAVIGSGSIMRSWSKIEVFGRLHLEKMLDVDRFSLSAKHLTPRRQELFALLRG